LERSTREKEDERSEKQGKKHKSVPSKQKSWFANLSGQLCLFPYSLHSFILC